MRRVPVGKEYHLAVRLCEGYVWVWENIWVECLVRPPWSLVQNGVAQESQNVSDCYPCRFHNPIKSGKDIGICVAISWIVFTPP